MVFNFIVKGMMTVAISTYGEELHPLVQSDYARQVVAEHMHARIIEDIRLVFGECLDLWQAF